MCHLPFLAALAKAAPLPAAVEAAVEAVAEAVADGEVMVMKMMVETEAAAGAYNNQPKSSSDCGRWQLRRWQPPQPWQLQRQR